MENVIGEFTPKEGKLNDSRIAIVHIFIYKKSRFLIFYIKNE